MRFILASIIIAVLISLAIVAVLLFSGGGSEFIYVDF